MNKQELFEMGTDREKPLASPPPVDSVYTFGIYLAPIPIPWLLLFLCRLHWPRDCIVSLANDIMKSS